MAGSSVGPGFGKGNVQSQWAGATIHPLVEVELQHHFDPTGCTFSLRKKLESGVCGFIFLTVQGTRAKTVVGAWGCSQRNGAISMTQGGKELVGTGCRIIQYVWQ